MENIFEKSKRHNEFSWETLGDIKTGRGILGEEMPVLIYRLMQYTMLDVLSKSMGLEKANEYFYGAGYLAGKTFAYNTLDLSVDLQTFLLNFQKSMRELKIGILRMESVEYETGDMVLTVGEDLDCSGLPITNETVCVYDEGFFAGVFEAYTGKKYNVKEVDCWANGDRVCRFTVHVAE